MTGKDGKERERDRESERERESVCVCVCMTRKAGRERVCVSERQAKTARRVRETERETE